MPYKCNDTDTYYGNYEKEIQKPELAYAETAVKARKIRPFGKENAVMCKETALIAAVCLIADIRHYRDEEQGSENEGDQKSFCPFDDKLSVGTFFEGVGSTDAGKQEHKRHIKRTEKYDETAYCSVWLKTDEIKLAPYVKRLCGVVRDEQ